MFYIQFVAEVHMFWDGGGGGGIEIYFTREGGSRYENKFVFKGQNTFCCIYTCHYLLQSLYANLKVDFKLLRGMFK